MAIKKLKQSEAGSDLSESPYEVAARENLRVVLPAGNELFIDIDDKDGLRQYFAMDKILEENGIYIEEYKRSESRTKGHWHIYARVLNFNELTPEQRIAFQACLGSDRHRELLSLLRVMLGLDRPPTVFFEEK